MKGWAEGIMKQVESNVKKTMREEIEKRLKPLQSEIRKEGASVRIVEKPTVEKPFSVTMDGASEELQNKIRKALSGK